MLKNMRIGSKLLIMVIIPVFGMAIFAARDMAAKLEDLRSLATTNSLTALAVRSGALIHELQKERGLSAGFIGSKGGKFREELGRQRAATDASLKELKEFISVEAGRIREAATRLDTTAGILEKLSTVRSEVDALKIEPKQAISFYTQGISSTLDVVAQIPLLSRNIEITRQAVAYHAFLSAKEQTGRERATLNGIFASNTLDAETLQRLVSIIAAQGTYLDVFTKYGPAEAQQNLRDKMAAPFARQVEEMRKVALTNGSTGNFGIAPETWFSAITAKINAMKEVEDLLAGRMKEQADTFAASARRSLITSAAIAVAVTAATLFFGFAIMVGITAPLRNMVAMLKDIAEGEGDLTRRLTTARNDEIGHVSHWFNRFVDNIQAIIVRVAETTAQVSAASERLQSTAEQIATAAEEVASQSATVATAGEEMSATSNDISRNCTLASEVSSRATDTANSGSRIVQTTLEGMQHIAERVQESATTVASLGSRSDQIGAIIGTIEDIADQTNLLALNAAIEAARAGEQGRGFAVVADEVRALAERTTRATREIGEMIKAIQSETSGAVSIMESGVAEVEKGMESSRQSGTALQEILDAINEVTMQVHQIATAAEEQTATTSEISTNIHQITEVVSETASGAHATAEAAADLNRLSRDLQSVVGRFKLA